MFVQFSDESQTKVISIFGCPQDEAVWPNQGEVDEDDPRYLAFHPVLPLAGLSDVEAAGRAWRNVEIARVTWLRDRHRDELELEMETTLTAEQYAELLAYIRDLRDWPQSPEFPAEDSRPVVPDWVANQIK
ncbi:phage tail protein [Pseudomonas mohnii]|jgi:hypothetical protein